MSDLQTLEIYCDQISSAFSKLETIIKEASSNIIDVDELNEEFSDQLKQIQSTVNNPHFYFLLIY